VDVDVGQHGGEGDDTLVRGAEAVEGGVVRSRLVRRDGQRHQTSRRCRSCV
jgi:hypothetical protein